jgi:serine/threonine-protein kinase
MPVDTAASLVNALRSTQVLSPAQLDEITKELVQRYPDARALARALIDREWLTPYQVNLLMQGAADKLSHGPYVIIERLGDNALGQVFKARHQLMNRLVTLTIVREELLAQPKAVEEFYQEIQAASQLSDPHILHSYDAGPIGKTHFFAMEHVDSVDLETLVQQSGPLQVSTAANFIHQAGEGLHHAHERGLLHHDLRPVNLLVAKNAVPGAASLASRTPLPSKTQLKVATLKISNLGLTMLQPRLRRAVAGVPTSEGTLDYVAPEQAHGTAPTDIRANLYSLGCIYYFLLAGRPPFTGGGSSTTLRQHQEDEPPPLESFRKDVPGETSKLIRTLLAKRPEDRYQTPAELLSALGPATTRKLPVGVRSTRVGLSKPPGPWQRLPKEYLLVGLAAGIPLLVAVIALGAWLLRPSGTQIEKSPGGKGHVSSPVATYVPKATYDQTILATLRANGYPSLEGKWHYIGPFDNPDNKGFETAYPPEHGIDLQRNYNGKGNKAVSWKDLPNFRPGQVYDIKQVLNHDHAVVYFYHEIEVRDPVTMDLSLGSDDTLTVWLNGQQLLANNVYRSAEPDQDIVTLYLKPGKNQLLLKICQGTGDWAFYVMPRWPTALKNAFGSSLQRDFPKRKS